MLTFCADPHLILFQFECESYFAAILVVHARERNGWQRFLLVLDSHHYIVRLAMLVKDRLVGLQSNVFISQKKYIQ